MLTVGINGFGRVGRMCLRVCLKKDIEVTHINDPFLTTDHMIYLFKYDTTHGTFIDPVENDNDAIVIKVGRSRSNSGDRRISTSHHKDPSSIPWRDTNVNFVIEASGVFTSLDEAKLHLEGGASHVIITASSSDAPMFIYGVNHYQYCQNLYGTCVSTACCTTNCAAPIIKVMDENFGVEEAVITNIQSIKPDMKIVEGLNDRWAWKNNQAVMQNIVPNSTDTAKCITRIIPELKDKISAIAFQVPVVNGSICDITFRLSKSTTFHEIKSVMRDASEGELQDVLGYMQEDCPILDFNHMSYSCIFDARSTVTHASNLIKVIVWYNNEYGYANRVLDLLDYIYMHVPTGIKILSPMHSVRQLSPEDDAMSMEKTVVKSSGSNTKISNKTPNERECSPAYQRSLSPNSMQQKRLTNPEFAKRQRSSNPDSLKQQRTSSPNPHERKPISSNSSSPVRSKNSSPIGATMKEPIPDTITYTDEFSPDVYDNDPIYFKKDSNFNSLSSLESSFDSHMHRNKSASNVMTHQRNSSPSPKRSQRHLTPTPAPRARGSISKSSYSRSPSPSRIPRSRDSSPKFNKKKSTSPTPVAFQKDSNSNSALGEKSPNSVTHPKEQSLDLERRMRNTMAQQKKQSPDRTSPSKEPSPDFAVNTKESQFKSSSSWDKNSKCCLVQKIEYLDPYQSSLTSLKDQTESISNTVSDIKESRKESPTKDLACSNFDTLLEESNPTCTSQLVEYESDFPLPSQESNNKIVVRKKGSSYNSSHTKESSKKLKNTSNTKRPSKPNRSPVRTIEDPIKESSDNPWIPASRHEKLSSANEDEVSLDAALTEITSKFKNETTISRPSAIAFTIDPTPTSQQMEINSGESNHSDNSVKRQSSPSSIPRPRLRASPDSSPQRRETSPHS